MARKNQFDKASLEQGACAGVRRACGSSRPMPPFPPAHLAVTLVLEWLDSHDSHRLSTEQIRQFAARCAEFFYSQAALGNSEGTAYSACASVAAINGQRAALEFEARIADTAVRAAFAALAESLLDTFRICSGLQRLRPAREDASPVACELWSDRPQDPTLYALTKRLTRVPRHALEV